MAMAASAFSPQRALDSARRLGLVGALRRAFTSRVARPLLRQYIYPWQNGRALSRMRRRNEVLRRSAPRPGGPSGRVLVIGCVDTEGPNGYAESGTWAAVEEQVDHAVSPAFRSAQCDSAGLPLALSWFVVDWMGAVGGTRGLDIGPHRVLDRYEPRVRDARAAGYADELHWHYHHVLPEGIDRWNREWTRFPQYDEILSRRLLDRGLWPSAYRAGNTWEDDDCSAWLERFLPFDLSNRAPYRDLHYDWSRAPSDWSVYHPDPRDYQRSGSQTRLMARSLGVEEGAFSTDDVEQAFLAAAGGRDSYVSYYLHDYRPMTQQIALAIDVIRRVGARFPGVEWCHRGAAAALRELAGRAGSPPLELKGGVHRAGGRTAGREGDVPDLAVEVESSHSIHGEPWLAFKRDGRYSRRDMQRIAPLRWRATLEAAGLEAVAVAACDPAGQAAVLRLSATDVLSRPS